MSVGRLRRTRGVRTGRPALLGASTFTPVGGVTLDTLGQKHTPATAGEWTTLRTAAGLGAVGGNPGSLFLLQEAAGNPADTLAARTLTINGTFTRQVAVPSWTRKGIKPGENTASDYAVLSGINVAATSVMLLAYIDVGSATSPAGERALWSLSDVTVSEARIGVSKVATAYSGVNTASGVTMSTVIPLVLKLDRSRSELVMYTLNDKLKPTYTAPAASTSGFLGGFANSSDSTHMYMALFTGAAAELSDAQVKTLLQTMGWSPTWT